MVLGSLPGSQNRSYAKFKATTANLEIGITAKITGASSADFQKVFLNLVAVRINPKPNSKNTNAPNQTDKKWFTIGVPTGSATPTSAKPGDVQIDMIAAQSQLQLFNIIGISPNTYHTLELVLDAVTPGTIVPICGTGIEGCINYPIQLQNRTTQLSITIPDGITSTQGTTLLLPIEITLDVGGKPTAPGAPYPITATVT